MRLIEKIKKTVLNYRIKKAIRQAVELAEGSGRKHLVLLHQGRPLVISKQRLGMLIRKRYFRKGTRIQDLERNALFITHLPHVRTMNFSHTDDCKVRVTYG